MVSNPCPLRVSSHGSSYPGMIRLRSSVSVSFTMDIQQYGSLSSITLLPSKEPAIGDDTEITRANNALVSVRKRILTRTTRSADRTSRSCTAYRTCSTCITRRRYEQTERAQTNTNRQAPQRLSSRAFRWRKPGNRSFSASRDPGCFFRRTKTRASACPRRSSRSPGP